MPRSMSTTAAQRVVDRLDASELVTAISMLRGAIGVGMVALPALLPRLLGADRRTARHVGYLVRMVGWREIALGAGTLAGVGASADGDPNQVPWIAAQAASDAGDAISLVLAARKGHVNRLTAAATALFAVGGLALDAVVLDRISRKK